MCYNAIKSSQYVPTAHILGEYYSSYHSRGLSGHLDGVSSVGDGHFRPVHDVQTGIQDSKVKLGERETDVK